MNLGLFGKPRHRPLRHEKRLAGITVENDIRTYSAVNTWETVSGTAVTWTSTEMESYRLEAYVTWRQSNGNWRQHILRALLDGAVGSTQILVNNESAGVDQSIYQSDFLVYDFLNVPPGYHEIVLQTHDNGATLSRTFLLTQLLLLRLI